MTSEIGIDRLDKRILETVSTNGRITITDLAKKIGLSKTPCQLRLKRLEEAGIITGYKAMLNPVKLGLDHVAFVEVKLTDTRNAALIAFNKAVMAVSEIEQCHMIAGSHDYLLKVRSQDIQEYRKIMGEVISALPHVGNTSTYVSMEAVKDEFAGGDLGE
ncbi:MAG: Lrp/AsnC ligand binding domain-containing protein [Pseudomonadota bacterium]